MIPAPTQITNLVSGCPIAAIANRSLAAVILNGRPPSCRVPVLMPTPQWFVQRSTRSNLSKRSEYAEYKLASGSGGIDCRAAAGQHFEAATPSEGRGLC